MSESTERAWERLPKETTKAYELFNAYLELGPERSLEKLRVATGKKPSYLRQLQRWCSEWAWPERAAHYDDHLQEMKRERHEDVILRMSERHAAELSELQEVLMEPVRELAHRIKNARQDGRYFRNAKKAELGSFVKEAGRLLPNLVQSERLVRGVSTSAPGAPEVPSDRSALEAALAGLDDGSPPPEKPKQKAKAK